MLSLITYSIRYACVSSMVQHYCMALRRKRKLQEDTEEHEGDSKALNGWMDGWMDGTMMMHWPSWDDGVAGTQEIVV